MHKNKVTGVTSGQHMGLYKALCTKFKNDTMTEKQKSMLAGVTAIINLCGQSGLIVPRFCKARDIMLQKKLNNFDI